MPHRSSALFLGLSIGRQRFALFAAALFTAMLLTAVPTASAQPAGGPLGIGAHVGAPTGVSVRYYDQPDAAIEGLAAFDLSDDYFYASLHRVWERSFQGTTSASLFHGPGLFASTASEDGTVGIGHTGGVSLPFDRFDAFLQLTPRLRLLPGTEFTLGGGVGLRYYFSD